MINTIIKVLEKLQNNIEQYSVCVQKYKVDENTLYEFSFKIDSIRYRIKLWGNTVVVSNYNIGTAIDIEMNDSEKYKIFSLAELLYKQGQYYVTNILKNFVNNYEDID